MHQEFEVNVNENTGGIDSVKLYGKELLKPDDPCPSEFSVNGRPLKLRKTGAFHEADTQWGSLLRYRMKGERFVDHFSGWGLVLARSMGERQDLKYHCYGINYLIRRENADPTCPTPGPGGPVVEAPLWVDSFSLLNLNWNFWGEDTRMIFPSAHSNGPSDEFGHVGYEHDTPENCKKFLQNDWRRIYPGVLVIHGGLFYNAVTGEWVAITCRRSHVGYILNMEDAGKGVSYDFTLHAPFHLGDSLRMPEIKIYYGSSREEMMHWLADYVTFYYEEPPEWIHKTLWSDGLCWNNKATWSQQGDFWEAEIEKGLYSGIKYSLVTNRPVSSGTSPMGYEPDPNHGSIAEFKKMCRRLTDKGIPMLIWMSHTGLLPGGQDIDDDWFMRGIDGRIIASWGNEDGGMMAVNPGHPGYIEYTKKWIRFYMKECGAKGIFMDCLGWAFPPDFKPRSFMRYPGDTNRMTIKFAEEIYACIKECDPEGILIGEGATLDVPVNVITFYANPVRAIDGMGPRDFFLQLNRYSEKRIVIDQGPQLFAASGICCKDDAKGWEEKNIYLNRLLREKGGRDAAIPLKGDLSILGDLLVVPAVEGHLYGEIRLPEPWQEVVRLVEETDGSVVEVAEAGIFRNVATGIYKMTGLAAVKTV